MNLGDSHNFCYPFDYYFEDEGDHNFIKISNDSNDVDECMWCVK